AIAEMGITGLLVDEKYGGTDAGTVAVERIMEQAGANLLGAPLLASAVMSVAAIQASEDEEAKARLLPGIAAGSSIATLLITKEAGDWSEAHVGLHAKHSKDGWLLNGTASLVIHGRSADIWLAVANTDKGSTLFELPRDAQGTSSSPLPSFDHTMVLDQITLKDSPATQVGKIGAGWQSIEEALSIGLVALAGEQAGGAQKILDITVDYAKIRHQFGRPIGSFQAIKHMAANLLLEVESAISAARNAAAKTDEEADDASAWRYLAGFACADAYGTTAADAVQMHGGIAFTWEHPAHLYLRRARATSQLLGSSDAYREKYLSAIGGTL
ncbi:MAG: acyl-CoA/acyl-ACP dehydrogenase, partial [Gammaproteobacteria bacterium]|nr:acyl-CoA/acyl-ACP dehydrogenase [Gammaproteobacteria bacterium]